MFTLPWLRDTAERTLATYVEAFLGFLIAAVAITDLSSLQAAGSAALFAAIPAALAVLKSAIAKRVGDPDSAALLK